LVYHAQAQLSFAATCASIIIFYSIPQSPG
jgi:hypothetical protein